ncbi:3-oxoadipyl-CoA thiolase [Actinomadura craniellae]|uniref:acetyl-CoA C-acyltransferase n=2 Tax=Actinomadura craniellae TaxID=2231787 RepID=A0A365HC35_9ACTN|nr:3-oxoadipyl-CoA thiolase [Actinomadura craniellae]
MTREAWIVAAVRTPIGRYGGALATVRPDDLAAVALRELIDRSGVPAEEVEDVHMGCANQAGEDNRNVARMAAILAGLPLTVSGVTVNRLCGSGMQAVADAARAVLAGEGEVHIGAGVESMSRAPWVLPKPDRPYAQGPAQLHDTSLGWRMVNPRMEELGHTDPLGITAENLAGERHLLTPEEGRPEELAREYDLSRAAQDGFALASHRKAVAAAEAGRFADEIVPVPVPQRRGDPVVFAADEAPRPDTSAERLAGLRPAFRSGGSVTAGNSSPLNDGAAAVMVVSAAYARAHGLRPLARIRASAVAGVPPRVMGIGPVPATAKLLGRTGRKLSDVDLIELNEAFAAQALAVLHEWDVDAADPRINVNGGAIALGHPLGCSGARIVTTLAHELRRRDDARLGLATMCIGVGQGIALLLEKVD